MLIVFVSCWGLVYYEFLSRGQIVNWALYITILWHLQETVPMKYPELWLKHSWLFHNEGSYTYTYGKVSYKKGPTPLLPQQFCSPVLSQTEFILFPELEGSLKRCWFESIEKRKRNARTCFPYTFVVVYGMLGQMHMTLRVY